MKLTLTIVALALSPLAAAATYPPPLVPDPPPVDLRVMELEREVRDLKARLAKIEGKSGVSKPPVAASSGHTHTCKACGTTWGELGHSHNCPTCGKFENAQDRAGSLLTITPSGGCANGSCESASSAGNWWYLGKNLGRRR